MSVLEPPIHLGDGARAVWVEIVEQFAAHEDDARRLSATQLEAYCGQMARMRDAQSRIDREGLVVADAKGNPIPHPALALEKQAQSEVRAWADKFKPRRMSGL